MDKISTGLTWKAVQDAIGATGNFSLVLNHGTRRTKKKLRNAGVKEERQLWRMFLQRNHGDFTTTIFNKNLHYSAADLLEQQASDAVIAQINNALAANSCCGR